MTSFCAFDSIIQLMIFMIVFVIRFLGLVHTDDRYALLDIARQLNLDTQLGDKINVSISL